MNGAPAVVADWIGTSASSSRIVPLKFWPLAPVLSASITVVPSGASSAISRSETHAWLICVSCTSRSSTTPGSPIVSGIVVQPALPSGTVTGVAGLATRALEREPGTTIVVPAPIAPGASASSSIEITGVSPQALFARSPASGSAGAELAPGASAPKLRRRSGQRDARAPRSSACP